MLKNKKSVQVEERKREYVPPDLLMVESKAEQASNQKDGISSSLGLAGESISQLCANHTQIVPSKVAGYNPLLDIDQSLQL